MIKQQQSGTGQIPPVWARNSKVPTSKIQDIQGQSYQQKPWTTACAVAAPFSLITFTSAVAALFLYKLAKRPACTKIHRLVFINEKTA
jgi:hypothetical protein